MANGLNLDALCVGRYVQGAFVFASKPTNVLFEKFITRNVTNLNAASLVDELPKNLVIQIHRLILRV